jgi:hypothetical protein
MTFWCGPLSSAAALQVDLNNIVAVENKFSIGLAL